MTDRTRDKLTAAFIVMLFGIALNVGLLLVIATNPPDDPAGAHEDMTRLHTIIGRHESAWESVK